MLQRGYGLHAGGRSMHVELAITRASGAEVKEIECQSREEKKKEQVKKHKRVWRV
jgi:hypothetical protein